MPANLCTGPTAVRRENSARSLNSDSSTAQQAFKASARDPRCWQLSVFVFRTQGFNATQQGKKHIGDLQQAEQPALASSAWYPRTSFGAGDLQRAAARAPRLSDWI
ncbi:hypothetical protein GUJ93_ZPchr0012g19314 [Zizania palustris]|uniref:Uncharacterized protein n=1 Tax=Zizania palustris TaxID=103762 RepID=A0A8J5WPU5_ZIZPA|nr:hypothetical protein GUJ93_ZPchr0012g19314 [Zizania palustris]